MIALRAAAADTAFHYQGALTTAGLPAQGAYDFAFSLHPTPDSDEHLSTTVTNSAVLVRDGLFTTDLNFGIEPFSGETLWLEIKVRPADSEQSFITLTPRQRVTQTPYAIHALKAQSTAQAEVALTVPGESVTSAQLAPQTIMGDRLADQQVVRSVNGLRDELLLNAGDNLTLSTVANAITISGSFDWKLTGNADTLPGKHFIGTTDPQPLEFKVNGNRALRLEPTSFPTIVNVIGGSSGNFVRPGISGATIAGGGAIYSPGVNDFTNAVHAEFGTIGGGSANLIGTNAFAGTISGGHLNSIDYFASESVIAGGHRNRIEEGAFRAFIGGGYLHRITADAYSAVISGGTSNTVSGYYSAVGGGSRNSIANNARYATIAGGGDNVIAANSYSGAIGGGGENQILEDAHRSTIAGGKLNRIGASSPHSAIGGGLSNQIAPNAEYGTIPGGSSNLVAATLGMAAGYRAQALHPGSYVWADSSDTDFGTIRSNEFAVRATGGARFVSGLDSGGEPVSGPVLEPGGGSWSSLSDRGAKTNFTAIQPREILEKLIGLTIETWNYRSQPEQLRHLGPTAQDFHAVFNIGLDDRHIACIDAHGVALAAIQGLNELLEEKMNRIVALESHAAILEARLHSLERQFRKTP